MTEATIRTLAIKYANTYYDMNQRSEKFRKAYPKPLNYVQGIMHLPDGSRTQGKPAWLHFVNLARSTLVEMLAKPDEVVSPTLKEKIMDALVEDREKQLKHQNVESIQQIGLEQQHG